MIPFFILALIILISILDYLLWKEKRKRVEKSFKYIETSFGLVSYLEIGEDNSETILFSNGGGTGIDSVYTLNWLAEAGFRVVSISRPGYYNVNFDPNFTLEDHARLYNQVLTKLGVDNPHLFGISAGSPSAILYSTIFGGKSLMLWSPVTGKYQPNQESMDSTLGKLILSRYGQNTISWLLSRSTKFFPGLTMDEFLKAESYLKPLERKEIISQELYNRETRKEFLKFVNSTTPMGRLFKGMMSEIDLMKDDLKVNWKDFKIPVYIVSSEVDKDVTISHLYNFIELVPDTKYRVVQAGGHFVWWGKEGHQVKVDTVNFFNSHRS